MSESILYSMARAGHVTAHMKGYGEARKMVLGQSRDEDVQLMQDLMGVPEGVNDLDDSEVKAMALEQLDREWSIPKEHIQYFASDEIE